MEKFGYICPECGKGTIKETTVINCQTKINNYPFIVPKAIVGVCDSCGAKNFDPQERERWVNLYNSGLEAKRVFLKAEQILHIRKKLGLNMEDFASLIGCTRQSIYNWEKKNRRIAQSRMADVIIKLLDECLNKGKVDVLSFLAQELKHLGVEIKIKPDVVTIVTSEKYETFICSEEEYAQNYMKPQGCLGFSPKLKTVS